MKKPYAESTLKRLYGKLNVQLASAGTNTDELANYVQACVNFYQIIEANEAWKMMKRALPKSNALRKLPRELFNAYLAIVARDEDMGYLVLPEKELFEDGGEGLFIVDELLTIEPNPEYGDKEKDVDCVANDKEYTGPSPMIQSFDAFYDLQKMREGKSLYIPNNILVYLDEDYYERTPQAVAMETFLRKEAKVPNDEIKYIMLCMLDDMRDILVPMNDMPQIGIDHIEQCGGSLHGTKQIKRFIDLLMDLSNNTRMPNNRGFTPKELMAARGDGRPISISFGPGIRKSIQNGDINIEEMQKAVASSSLPREIKESMLSELEKATHWPN